MVIVPCTLASIAAMDRLGTRRVRLLSMPAIVAVNSAALIYYAVARRRLRRTVTAASGAICPRCGYSLIGHDEEALCPECGAPFAREELARLWRGWGYL